MVTLTTNTQEVKIEKKDLNIRQYGIKRKYKLERKFKCKLCGEKLSSDQEFNQHCLDNHPPDIHNVRAHSKVHSDRLPYHCPLCHKGFK